MVESPMKPLLPPDLGQKLLRYVEKIPPEQWEQNHLVVIQNEDGVRRVAPRIVLEACSPLLRRVLDDHRYTGLKLDASAKILDAILEFIFLSRPVDCSPQVLLEYAVACDQLGLEDLSKLIENEFFSNVNSCLSSAEFLNDRHSSEHVELLTSMINRLQLSECAKNDLKNRLREWRPHRRRADSEAAVADLTASIRKSLKTAYMVLRQSRDNKDGTKFSFLLRNVRTSEDMECALDFSALDLQNSVIDRDSLLAIKNGHLVKYDLVSGANIAQANEIQFRGLAVSNSSVYAYTESGIYLMHDNRKGLELTRIAYSPIAIRHMQVTRESADQRIFVIQNTHDEIWLLTMDAERSNKMSLKMIFRSRGHLAGVHRDQVFLFHITKNAFNLVSYSNMNHREIRRFPLDSSVQPLCWCTYNTDVFYKYANEKGEMVSVVFDMDRGELVRVFNKNTKNREISSVLPGLMLDC